MWIAMNGLRRMFALIGRAFGRVKTGVDWVFQSLSVIHPLYFLTLYVSSIPLFAWAYMSLSGSFYAPYAKLEPSALADARAISRALEGAVREHLATLEERRVRIRTKDTDTEWRVLPDRAFVTGGDITGNTIKLIVGVGMSQGAEEKLLANLPVMIRSFRVGSEGKEDVIVHVDYDQEAITAEPLKVYIRKYHVFAGMPIVLLSWQDRQLIANYLDGYAGDPNRISANFFRMLYFSVVVITTVGFGDIVPMTGGARALVAFEAITGVLLVGLFLNSVASRRQR